MQATLTLVLCLVSAPEQCEVRQKRVDAQACFYGGANVVAAETPDGFRAVHARCDPDHRGNLVPASPARRTG